MKNNKGKKNQAVWVTVEVRYTENKQLHGEKGPEMLGETHSVGASVFRKEKTETKLDRCSDLSFMVALGELLRWGHGFWRGEYITSGKD